MTRTGPRGPVPDPAARWTQTPPLLAAQIDKRAGAPAVQGPGYSGLRAGLEGAALRLTGDRRDRGPARDLMICRAEAAADGRVEPVCRAAVQLSMVYDTFAPDCETPDCVRRWTRPELVLRLSPGRLEIRAPESDSGPDPDTRWTVTIDGERREIGAGLTLLDADARAFIERAVVEVAHLPAQDRAGLLWARRKPFAWPPGPRLAAFSAPFEGAAVKARLNVRAAAAITGVNDAWRAAGVTAITKTGRLLVQSVDVVHEDAAINLSQPRAVCGPAWRPRLSVAHQLRRDAATPVLGSVVLHPLTAARHWDWDALVSPRKNPEACAWAQLSLWTMSAAIDALSKRGPRIDPDAPSAVSPGPARGGQAARPAQDRVREAKERLKTALEAREAADQAPQDSARNAETSAAAAPDRASSSAAE